MGFFIATAAHAFQVVELQTDNYDGYVVTVPWPKKSIASNAWDCFSFCSLALPSLLEQAHKENKPVTLAIPDCYHQAKTTSNDASLIEGARVALAWLSTYYRFHNTDIRVITVNNKTTQEDIYHACSKFIPTKNDTKKTPELRMTDRIVSIDLPTTKSPIESSVQELSYAPMNSTTLFSPTLPKQQENQKRIVITGGAGFIGSHLTEKFLKDGHQVIVLDDFSCCTKTAITSFKQDNLIWFEHDVSKPFDIEGTVDIVIHLASHPSPVDYYNNPIDTMRSGLHGTKNALELARTKNARFVLGSTSEVYGDPHVHPQPEYYPGHVDPIGKRSQYDQSKRGAETWCKYYFDTYNIDIRILRIFNTYGPRMRLGDGRVVTNFIKAILENSKITIYGSGNQTRSFGYVSDTVDGIYRITTQENINDFSTLDERIFNVGNPQEYSINQVAIEANKLSQQYFERPTQITHIPQFDMSDPKVRCPNIQRIQTITGYKPIINFQEGLEKTFLYFKNNIHS